MMMQPPPENQPKRPSFLTAHLEEAGENYLEHLWFTLTMAGRLLYSGGVLVLHGMCPFLCTRTASTELEKIYRIMKSRIPRPRREEIDAEYLDYQV